MNIEIVVKLIKGVCLLILERPEAARMERLIAEKVLSEVEEGFGPDSDGWFWKRINCYLTSLNN